MSYNGYPNYETWNICLWVDNEYSLYQSKLEFLRQHAGLGVLSSSLVREFCEDLFPNGTPDMDPGDMDKVNWRHVTTEWLIEQEEL